MMNAAKTYRLLSDINLSDVRGPVDREHRDALALALLEVSLSEASPTARFDSMPASAVVQLKRRIGDVLEAAVRTVCARKVGHVRYDGAHDAHQTPEHYAREIAGEATMVLRFNGLDARALIRAIMAQA